MQQAGIEQEQVVLLLEDYQFVDPTFLELINSLLSAGEVPGLYSPEELEPLLSPLRDMASEAGFRGTLINFFASSRSLRFLFVLLMLLEKPTRTNCRIFFKKNNSLVYYCSMIYFFSCFTVLWFLLLLCYCSMIFTSTVLLLYDLCLSCITVLWFIFLLFYCSMIDFSPVLLFYDLFFFCFTALWFIFLLCYCSVIYFSTVLLIYDLYFF